MLVTTGGGGGGGGTNSTRSGGGGGGGGEAGAALSDVHPRGTARMAGIAASDEYEPAAHSQVNEVPSGSTGSSTHVVPARQLDCPQPSMLLQHSSAVQLLLRHGADGIGLIRF